MIFQLIAVLAVTVLLFWGIIVQEAYAYLDFGTGSYFFQFIIAFIIGGLYAIKLFWNKIASFIKKLFKRIINE